MCEVLISIVFGVVVGYVFAAVQYAALLRNAFDLPYDTEVFVWLRVQARKRRLDEADKDLQGEE